MQQSPQMIPMVLPSFPPTNNITTEQIQKVTTLLSIFFVFLLFSHNVCLW